ncbi:NAD(P)/FAD-dependent oxidoreductase [Streptomyces sp. AV19]|uniref:NAD(P)/FAD-dependent oxidoreductase n=1 Tax=Streptomyces sp. AV19 TaxID=2793068 RepID=UPI0018FE146B|nr:FAD-dependent oxidoreductase [Streptomyces sp. AV19]MBH1937635.1 NAD(P)/FAD-dependent oxidoreductase [Streptomyces sp. AV19]MDG4536304.1 FAD-dependent oxidoreductase [Streptomyces sp. AV19]
MSGGARRVAVVGAGMAAARFASRLLGLAPPGGVEVTLYGDEPCGPYNRALLTGALRGRPAPGELGLPTGGATVSTGTEVVAVDVAARTLRTACGVTAPYDVLVLATGAGPVLPELAGPLPRAGVHRLRTLADRGRLAADVRTARTVVVVGGGVLGVGAAQALAGRGTTVHLAHRSPRLLARHLDAGAAATVRRALEAAGVVVHAAPVVRLLGDERVTGAELADGSLLDAGAAVLACGVRPRTGLARAAGLKVADGVVVDDALAASAPGVYAIGDCAEHRGAVHGRAEAAWAQADALAARLSGAEPEAVCGDMLPYLRLSAGELEVAAFGDSAGEGTGAVVLADARDGTYRKLVLRGDVVVGAVLVGDVGMVGEVGDVVARGDGVEGDAVRLLLSGG